MSLVEVSPSTVIALKVFSTFFFNKLLRTDGAMFASVNIKPSSVPIFGNIIPDPFAIPEMFTVFPPMVKVSKAIFAIVSVVMMV